MCECCDQKALIPESDRVYVNGIWIDGEIPYIVDRFKGKTLLVMGTGHTLWSDVAQVYDKWQGWHFMTINRATLDFLDPIDHHVGCHPYDVLLFGLYRRAAYPNQPHVYTHSCRIHDEVSHEQHLIPQFLWDFPDYYHGSSVLTGVLAGLAMGYERIVLAGVPLEGGYYYNPYWYFPYKDTFISDWEKAAKVTSLSGLTRELLGEPKWLHR
jgi:hypothetical protein